MQDNMFGNSRSIPRLRRLVTMAQYRMILHFCLSLNCFNYALHNTYLLECGNDKLVSQVLTFQKGQRLHVYVV